MILAIDSSGKTASVAFVEGGVVLSEFSINNQLTHSVTLMPLIEQMSAISGIALDTISAIGVAIGPGSFTGLRIGVACAKGLAFALNKKIVPVPTLDALAYNIPQIPSIICPVMDARRSEVYTCVYQYDEGGNLVKLTDYLAVPITEISEILLQFEGMDVYMLGDGVVPNFDLLKAHGFKFAHPNSNFQRAASVGCLAEARIGEAVFGDQLEVMYLRKPQAERQKMERENK